MKQPLQLLALQAVGAHSGELVGCRVRLADAVAVRLDDQHCLARAVEQHAIARFKLAHAHIVALQRLLHLQQALLGAGCVAQIAAQREVPPFAEVDERVAHRHIALAGRVVDLPPASGFALARRGEHFHHLRTTFDGYRFEPVRPGPLHQIGKLPLVYRHVEDVTGIVEHERDIARRKGQALGGICVERAEMLGGIAEFAIRVGAVLLGQHLVLAPSSSGVKD